MAVLIATPLAVVASDAFTDVPDSNVHHDDITWLRDNGVTFGCNPPANTEFCPGDPVLRQQMASFMRRLAENEVVNAATANEADHADTADEADHADTAGDAQTLQGNAPTDFHSVGDNQILQKGPWTINQNIGSAIADLQHFSDLTRMNTTAAGTAIMQLDLNAPQTIDGVTYGLQSAEICYAVTSGDAITDTEVHDNVDIIIDDATPRTETDRTCYAVAVDSPTVPNNGLRLLLWFDADAAGDDLDVYGVTSTWTPTTETLTSVDEAPGDASSSSAGD